MNYLDLLPDDFMEIIIKINRCTKELEKEKEKKKKEKKKWQTL